MTPQLAQQTLTLLLSLDFATDQGPMLSAIRRAHLTEGEACFLRLQKYAERTLPCRGAALAGIYVRGFAAEAAPAAVKPKVRIGKPGNNVKIGIVGMPNIGKSTTFNCLSMQNVPAENFVSLGSDSLPIERSHGAKVAFVLR